MNKKVPCLDFMCVANSGYGRCVSEPVVADWLRGKDSCIGRRDPGDMGWQRKYMDRQGLSPDEKCTIQEAVAE